MSDSAAILFLSDTHLGFDQPLKPRIQRRRRGPDFKAHYLEALAPAFRGEVDCVLHGGDLYYRSRIPDSLIAEAFEPLLHIADSGIPVLLVPGNHERGNIRQSLLEKHEGIHVFNRPGTVELNLKGMNVSFSAFPFHRDNIRDNFQRLVKETGAESSRSDFRFLCVHQAFSGAAVGIQNYRFRRGKDVIDPLHTPSFFQAVLSGHIHRYQFLERSLSGEKLKVPVLYPGSINRTSFAERREAKGYCLLNCRLEEGKAVFSHSFVPVSSRPMFVLYQKDLPRSKEELKSKLKSKLCELPEDAVVMIRFAAAHRELSAGEIREMIPDSMNVEIRYSEN